MSERSVLVLPAPPPGDICWRAPTPDDVPAIAVLYGVCCDADDTYRTAESEILEYWDSPLVTPATDALVGFNADGDLVAGVWSLVDDSAETKRRAFGFENRIDPSYRTDDVREFVLAWWEARSRQKFAQYDDDLPRALWHSPYSHQADEIDFLHSHGYEVVRYFHELGRDLREPLEVVEAPPGIDMREHDTNRTDALEVHNLSFADHWGSEPISVERWNMFYNEFYMPEASFVAYDGEVPVSYVMSVRYPHDFGDRGWPHAWIDGVGTVRSHRGLGVASSLISMAMEAMKKNGMEYAVLGVDAENPTGAYGVYEKLGFHQLRAEVAFEKRV